MKAPKGKNINLSASLDEIRNFAGSHLPNEAFEEALIKEIASGYSIEPDGVDGGSRTRVIYEHVEKIVRETNKQFREWDDYFARDNIISIAFNKAPKVFGGPKVNLESAFLQGSSYLAEQLRKHSPKTP